MHMVVYNEATRYKFINKITSTSRNYTSGKEKYIVI